MSSVRFHSSFTGLPVCFDSQAASTMKSLESRRPKPPPQRVMCTSTLAGGTPRVLATSWRPASGFWVGAQISTLSPTTSAVQFCGSSGAWARNG